MLERYSSDHFGSFSICPRTISDFLPGSQKRLVIFFSLTEAPLPDSTLTPPNTPKRTQNRPETEPNRAKRSRNGAKRSRNGPKSSFSGWDGRGVCRGKRISLEKTTYSLFQGGPGSVRFGYGLGMERFKRFRLSVLAVPLQKKGFVCVAVEFNRKGRFRFWFRFLENGSGGSGSAFGFGKNGSDGSGCRFRFVTCSFCHLEFVKEFPRFGRKISSKLS